MPYNQFEVNTVTSMSIWKLGYVLSNLEIRESFEVNSNTVALVPFDDPRLLKIQEVSKGANKLLNGFRDEYGHSRSPSALIYRDDAPDKVKSVTAMVDFRNCIAMACILPGWGHMNFSQISSPSNPLWSDFFDLYPVVVGSQDTLIVINAALMVGSSENAPFVGMPSPYIKQPSDRFMVDFNLLQLLLAKWEERYIKPGSDNWDRRKLFRSLEMAYRALTLPVKNQGGMHDFGSSLALWVSALEILAHPKDKGVNKTTVFELLSRAQWRNPPLRHRRFRLRISNKIKSVTLVERICNGLYDARNAFLHGNAIYADHWRYKGRKVKTALGNVAPVIYRTALMSYLDWRLPSSTDINDRIIQMICDQVYEDFLLQFLRVQ
ncbi:hypothetical protein FY534_07895 [Alicyclobacillus sp. TC]|nr:hypothetical protein FY534_07895 [Alicyclobacillus sp. TC]